MKKEYVAPQITTIVVVHDVGLLAASGSQDFEINNSVLDRSGAEDDDETWGQL